ncbi:MAG: hypothetical protein JWN23_1550 [Rhodocyclales bacterium]|nr:hypothetical protein [Rhodocyclales bacterium]
MATQQPQVGPIEIDWANPLTRGLVDAWVFGSLVSLVKKNAATLGAGSNGITTGRAGLGVSTPSGGAPPVLASLASDLLPTGPCTIIYMRTELDTSRRTNPAFATPFAGTSTTECHAFVPYSDGSVYWRYGDGTGISATIGASNGADVFGFMAGGAAGRQIWQNGVLIASDSNTITRTATSAAFNLGDSSNGGPDVRTYCLYVFARQFSANELRAITANPWQILLDEDEEFDVTQPVPSGGGGTSYNYTPSGGVVFGGAATPSKGKVFNPGGGIQFGGSAQVVHGKVFQPSGGMSFGGSAIVTHSKVYIPSGGIVFGGAASTSSGSSHTYLPSGGIIFGGTAPAFKGKSYIPSGGFSFGGSASISKGKTFIPSGGITFSGAADTVGPGGVTQFRYFQETLEVNHVVQINERVGIRSDGRFVIVF